MPLYIGGQEMSND